MKKPAEVPVTTAPGTGGAPTAAPVTRAAPRVRAPAPDPESWQLPERYAVVRRLGQGGMGVVLLVHDRVLDRPLAMKLILGRLDRVETLRARFHREAQITAALQHPGVVPVYDFGTTRDQRPWYTMRAVDGATSLHERIHGGRPFPLGEKLDVYLAIVETLAWVHGQGYIHRDLKPGNVLLAPNGEVLVSDWGLARRLGDSDGAWAALSSGGATRLGVALGTVPYLPPEQALGRVDQHGPPSDVYALGVLLGELLTGRWPYPADPEATLDALRAGRSPEDVYAGADVPPALAELGRACLATEPSARPTAAEVGRRVREWRDADRRRATALEAVRAADALLPALEAARRAAAEGRREAERLLQGVPAWEGVDRKRAAWGRLEAADAAEREHLILEQRYLQALRGALNLDAELPDAHQRLADTFRARAEEALAAGETARAEALELLVREHDRGRHARWLAGTAALTLHTDPPGAVATLFRFVPRDRRLVPERVRELGRTPLDAVEVPHGSYLVELRAEGRLPVRYPVRVGRDEAWDGVRPGDSHPFPIHLPPAAGWDADEVYVPAGWFESGGDPAAGASLSRRRLWVDAFVLRRFPVTVAAYLRFLEAVAARDGLDAARALAPAEAAGFGSRPRLLVRWRGRRCLPAADAAGVVAEPDWPVTQVDVAGAEAFLAWERERDGRAWRLPHDQEWEKAARGVDGRPFPWGWHHDPAFSNMVQSHDGPPRLAPVHAFPLDESPYGVRGLAGNVRDICRNGFTREGPPDGSIVDVEEVGTAERMGRGGAWAATAPFCRSAARYTIGPGQRFSAVGFRSCRSLSTVPAT